MVAILSVCWLCNHSERGEGGRGGGSWIHRYTHLPLSTSFFLLFLPYSPSYTANLCISHACRLQVSSHWGNMSYLTLFIDYSASECVHSSPDTRICIKFPINSCLCQERRAGNLRVHVRSHFSLLCSDVITDGSFCLQAGVNNPEGPCV